MSNVGAGMHMTRVIGSRVERAYALPMKPSSRRSRLATLLEELDARIDDTAPRPEDALAIGEALLAFADLEDEAFSALAPLLDPAVTQELVAEHQQIAEDLTLLEWLVRTAPDSSDVPILTTSLVRRMRVHVDRDERLLARAEALTPNP